MRERGATWLPIMVIFSVAASLAISTVADGVISQRLDRQPLLTLQSGSTNPANAGTFHPVTLARILDTRRNLGGSGPVAARESVSVQILGRGGMPVLGVSAVTVNLTVVTPAAPGYLTAYADGSTAPTASNLNFIAGQTIANQAIVPVGPDGRIRLSNGSAGTVQLIADVAGYYTSGVPAAAGSFQAARPFRALDTRRAIGAPGPVAAASSIGVQVLGRGGVPGSGVSAVVVNITVTAPTRPGTITAYADGAARPTASNLNFVAGQTIANLAVVPIGADGRVRLLNSSPGTVQLLMDVAGYYRGGQARLPGSFGSLAPARLLDTRANLGGSGPVAAAGSIGVRVLGRGGVPASGVSAVVVNLTVTGPERPGSITAYADGAGKPTASNLNFVANQTIANLAVVPVGADGRIRLSNNSAGTLQLIADVAGYFLAGGTLRSWGAGAYGQLGNGQTFSSSLPLTVSGLSDVVDVAAGGYSAYALRGDGTVWAWGWNYVGEIGDGTTVNRSVPVQVQGLTGVTAIASGFRTGYALRRDGTVWAWGGGWGGELGNGSIGMSTAPVQVTGLTSVTAIAAAADTGFALRADGTIWSWGTNFSGELGDGSTDSQSSVPVQVSGLAQVTAVAGGGSRGYALRADGSVWDWGSGTGVTPPNGIPVDSHVPVRVPTSGAVTAVAAGESDGYLLQGDGTVWAWGYGFNGELGNGSRDPSDVPVPVSGLSTVTSISGGGRNGYAVRSDGVVWAWGSGGSGQLGNGTTSDSLVPVKAAGLSGVMTISAGDASAYALVHP